MATTTWELTPELLAYLATTPLSGGEPSGYSTDADSDARITRTADGVNLNQLWLEFADVLSTFNSERTALASLLSFDTTAICDAVPLTVTSQSFEGASEFGVPKTIRQDPAQILGYGFDDFDMRASYTWKWLRSASADQARNLFVSVIEADNKLVTGTILRRLFSPTQGVNEQGNPIFGLWNNDGIAPLPVMGRTFTSTTNYLGTGAGITAIDSGDVEAGIRKLVAFGYGTKVGSQLLILANPDESERIQSWRAGQQSRAAVSPETDADVPKAAWDFIPSTSAPAYTTPNNIIGAIPTDTFNGVKVTGQYGRALLVESNFIPSGYFAVVATGGPGSLDNPVALRQHESPEWRGLRQIPGPVPGYPLQDSFATRAFGVGVRHRGAASCFKIGAASYTAPTATQIPV